MPSYLLTDAQLEHLSKYYAVIESAQHGTLQQRVSRGAPVRARRAAYLIEGEPWSGQRTIIVAHPDLIADQRRGSTCTTPNSDC